MQETILPKHDPESCERVPCGRCRPQGKPQVPPVGQNPQNAAAPPPAPDAVVRSIGLPRHPGIPAIVEADQNRAQWMVTDGDRLLEYASLLASQGYANSTLGDGGSRGTDSTSSTERTALRDHPGRWVGVDAELASRLRDYHLAGAALDALHADVLHHAADLDPVPAGTGECLACGRFCRPSKDKPGNRLRSGLCPTHHRAWCRAGRPDRGLWIRQRRTELTDEHGVLHTPEPDHDIDLSRETA